MSGKTAPSVPLTLDKPRRLVMDFNALVSFEEATGKNVLQPGAMDGMTLKDIRAMVWACLIHDDPALTVDQVGAMLHPGNLQMVMAAVKKVQTLSSQEGGGDEKGPRNRSNG